MTVIDLSIVAAMSAFSAAAIVALAVLRNRIVAPMRRSSKRAST
jgi:hypothetical protein